MPPCRNERIRFRGLQLGWRQRFLRQEGPAARLPVLSAAEGFVLSNHRHSRDEPGNFSSMVSDARIEAIRELPLYDVGTNRRIQVKDIIRDTSKNGQ